jgi:hypothetical protein
MLQILAATLLLIPGGQSGAPHVSEPSPSSQQRGKFATDRDRVVLEALLLSVLADREFPPPASAEMPQIVLHRRTPKIVEPIINTMQVNFECGGKVMPKDAWDDLERRNVVRLDPNARLISYEGLQFDPRIQIGNVFPGPESTFVGKTFEEVFPQARGWVEAYVPGFSKDGKTAVVRGRIGPSDKRAMLSAILNVKAEKWVVIWRRYCVYV